MDAPSLASVVASTSAVGSTMGGWAALAVTLTLAMGIIGFGVKLTKRAGRR